MNNDITCVFEGIGSVGALYISNSKSANNMKILEKCNIKAIVTASKGNKINDENQNIQKYMYLQIEDRQDFQIERYFQRSFLFIDETRKSSNVLIHCQKGINQSVVIILAYLIRKYHYSLNQAYTIVKRKRQRIEPNPYFMKKLQIYSKKYALKNDQQIIVGYSQKPIFKRSNSLNTPSKQSLKEFYENIRLVNSDVLKQKTQKTSLKHDLSEQEKQKIQSVLKQRQQIEYKLRNLRYELVRGRNIRNFATTNETPKSFIKIESPLKKEIQTMRENKDPNEQVLEIKDLKLSKIVQKRVKFRGDHKCSFQDEVLLSQSINLKD